MGIKKGSITEKDYIFDIQSESYIAKCRFCGKVVNQGEYNAGKFDSDATYQRNIAGMRKHLSECPWNQIGVDTTLLEESLQKHISEGKLSSEQVETLLTDYSYAVLMEAAIQHNFFISEAHEMIEE